MSYTVRLTSSALGNYLRCYAISRKDISTDILGFFDDCRNVILALICHELNNLSGIKVWICAIVEFVRTADTDHETVLSYFGKQYVVLDTSAIDSVVDQAAEHLRQKSENFEQRGSNWTLLTIRQLDFHFYKYSPLRSAGFEPLPANVVAKRAVVNVRNKDDECFRWSVLAALHPATQHRNRVSNYTPFRNELSFDGIQFPVRICDIDKFSEQNDISVNVYSCDGVLRPVRLAKPLQRHVNLLTYRGHYSLITSLDRLLGDQNGHNGKSHYCARCLFPFYNASALRSHEEYCKEDSLIRLELPDAEKSVLKFDNLRRTIRNPVVVYADFECILRPIVTCMPPPGRSHTEKLQEHIPCSFGAISVESCCGDELRYGEYESDTGEDCVLRFVGYLLRIALSTYHNVDKFPTLNHIVLSDSDKTNYAQAKVCWICKHELGNDRVRDHCHVCGKFRGAAHSKCNTQLQVSKTVVVLLHNLRRYDAHILVKAFGKICSFLQLELTCIPKGAEDYISFTMKPPAALRRRKRGVGGQPVQDIGYKIVFVDSCQFLPCSLDELAKSLPSNAFEVMDRAFPPDRVDLLKRKGVFPYDFLDDWQKLKLSVPPTRNDFFNKLTNSAIEESDYQHMLAVWEAFTIGTLGEYMELYLETDVRILCAVFEAFRKFSLANFELDPCHYYTLPGLGWDACLKLTNVRLELLTDPSMYAFFEQGIRGGISTICQRYAKANNPYLDDYNATQQSSYIVYLDANNLYGWSMMQPLPLDGFEWMSDEELAQFDVSHFQEYGEVGCVLEVDMDYPEELHDEHNCLPLAVERVAVNEEMLSPYCRDLLGNGRHVSSAKLVPNLRRKCNYIVHARNLKFYVSMGLEIRKIHRGVKFRQHAWMVPYIEFNTQRRKEAKSVHEKNLYKLLNNAVFGKTMENVRKYQRIVLVSDRKKFLKTTKQPEFQNAIAFTADLVACRMRQKTIMLNKPVYVGFTVLDLSKLLMYRYHYTRVKPKYGSRARLLMTDTDSLMYHVVTADIYKDFAADLDDLDTSDYPASHPLFSERNKKVVGKMKDETNGKPISEFVGLRSKMYSFRCGDAEHKRAKGVKKQVVKRTLRHQDYVDILHGRTYRYDDMCLIRSNLHTLYTINLRKKSLAAFDDKRYILEDGETSLAYGHFRIPAVAAAAQPSGSE